MRHAGLIASALTGLGLGLILGQNLFGLLVFLLAASLGGYLATRLHKGSERVYWGFVGLTLALWLMSIIGLNLNRLIIILPLVLTAGYFVARLIGRFTGTRNNLPEKT